jgi:hypothetical protein
MTAAGRVRAAVNRLWCGGVGLVILRFDLPGVVTGAILGRPR